VPAVNQAIAATRDFGWGVQRIADELGIGHGTVQRELERTGRNRLPEGFVPSARHARFLATATSPESNPIGTVVTAYNPRQLSGGFPASRFSRHYRPKEAVRCANYWRAFRVWFVSDCSSPPAAVMSR